MLWFPVLFTKFLPGWLINVATIIHSDEALLATGFIFTVHFFNTHLRPEKFPMDTVVFTGRMPVAEWKRDKPAEYEALVAAGKLEENLVEPYQPVVIRTIRAFAWTALAIGTLIVLVDRLRDGVCVPLTPRSGGPGGTDSPRLERPCAPRPVGCRGAASGRRGRSSAEPSSAPGDEEPAPACGADRRRTGRRPTPARSGASDRTSGAAVVIAVCSKVTNQ